MKTFTYVETSDSDMSNELMDKRMDRPSSPPCRKGLQQVDEGGDIYVTYHVSEDNTVFNTTNYGYGGWRRLGWLRWVRLRWLRRLLRGMGPTTTADTYTEGTLILDAYEPAEKTGLARHRDGDPQSKAREATSRSTTSSRRWAPSGTRSSRTRVDSLGAWELSLLDIQKGAG